MNEQTAIQQISQPNTVQSLEREFRHFGIQSGMTLLVHSSLSSLGWVCGGAVAVIQALMAVLTADGTLVMPTHSGDLSNPARWAHPPVPEEWWQTIRETMPAFHPAYTPTRGMGSIPEVFRTMPGVMRSNHPTLSFAAYGRHAEMITGPHPLEYSLGDGTPLSRVYELNGSVLLLGVGFANNTSFHLAEHRAKGGKFYKEGSPVFDRDGKRTWQWYDEIDWDDEPFKQIGEDFERTGQVRSGKIGLADTRLFLQRPAVDFAVDWLNKQRGV